jgi:hypothetical protein
MKFHSLLTGAFFAVAFSAGAVADAVTFKAGLNGSQEVPANGTAGTGTATATYDSSSKIIKWTVSYSGLTGPATMGHIHGPADPGKNAPVVVPFANAASPIEGSATLTDAQAADLLAGKYYVNVHTAENKGGEIRGQLLPAK